MLQAADTPHGGRQLRIMSDDHKGGCDLFVEFPDQGLDLLARVVIQVTRGFIHEHAPGLVDQGPGNGHPLAFAAGQGCGLVRQTLTQSDALKQMARPVPGITQ